MEDYAVGGVAVGTVAGTVTLKCEPFDVAVEYIIPKAIRTLKVFINTLPLIQIRI